MREGLKEAAKNRRGGRKGGRNREKKKGEGDYGIRRSSKMSPVHAGRKKRREHIKPRDFWKVLTLVGFSQSPMCYLHLPGT